MAVKELVVGNLNVVFVGEKRKYDLLDFWNEIISHIFVNDISMGRTPKLLLKDIRVTTLGKQNDKVIIGRYVKSTVLSIKQVLENNELVPRNEQYDSAPSAVFVYILKNHILLYWGEHPGYPSVISFKTFLQSVINRYRKRYIKILNKNKTAEEKLETVNDFPPAYVSFVPLPLTRNIESQFSDLIKVNSLFVRQYNQNANIDYRAVMGTNQTLMAKVKSQRLDYSLIGIQDIEGTKELVKDIAIAGDSDFRVNGSTETGKKMITNEGVQYSEIIENISANSEIELVAEKIMEVYESDLENGNIPNVPDKNSKDLLDRV